VQADGAEIAVTAAKAAFDDKGKADAIKGAAGKRVVDAAECDGGLVVATRASNRRSWMRATNPRCSAQLAIARVFITPAIAGSVRIEVLQVDGVMR
jgi:hypothetical protein